MGGVQYPTIPLCLDKVGLSILRRNPLSLIHSSQETDVNKTTEFTVAFKKNHFDEFYLIDY